MLQPTYGILLMPILQPLDQGSASAAVKHFLGAQGRSQPLTPEWAR